MARKMPRANWSVLREYPVAVPEPGLAKGFTDFVMNLRRTRDLLIPRLLAGQLSLAEIEDNRPLVMR